MATPAEINAGFDVAESGIRALISDAVPGFFQARAAAELAQHRADVLAMVKAVLAAAERARVPTAAHDPLLPA